MLTLESFSAINAKASSKTTLNRLGLPQADYAIQMILTNLNEDSHAVAVKQLYISLYNHFLETDFAFPVDVFMRLAANVRFVTLPESVLMNDEVIINSYSAECLLDVIRNVDSDFLGEADLILDACRELFRCDAKTATELGELGKILSTPKTSFPDDALWDVFIGYKQKLLKYIDEKPKYF